jgi:hypothetical protein
MIETALVSDPEAYGQIVRTALEKISQTIPFGSL